MEYKYCGDEDFGALASGRVLYGGAGIPNFPVRLGNEIYRRCLSYLDKSSDITVYDLCCGGGYLLTVLGFLNESISRLIGSDISDDILAVARKNLSLLTREGPMRRERELEELYSLYGKQSHAEALESLRELRGKIGERSVESTVLRADCTKPLPLSEKPDIIITDVPYGDLASWQGGDNAPIDEMCAQLCDISRGGTVLAVVSDKKQRARAQSWAQLEKQLIGKRMFTIYRRL